MGVITLEIPENQVVEEITGNLHVVADDPDDNKLIECALQAGARVIVSGDHHLLDIGEYGGVCVLSAADFVARYA